MASGLDRFAAWRWMPCASLSAAATGFVVLAVLLAPRPAEEGDLADTASSMSDLAAARGNARYLSAAQTAVAPGAYGAREALRTPRVPGFVTPGSPPPGYAPPLDSQPAAEDARSRENIVSRASYGVRRFAEMAKVGVAADGSGAPTPPGPMLASATPPPPPPPASQTDNPSAGVGMPLTEDAVPPSPNVQNHAGVAGAANAAPH